MNGKCTGGGELRGAFTLIELLIVIAIIAILAALLLPALNKAQQTAHKVDCLNKLKQFALADASYANDYKEYLAPVRLYPTQTTTLRKQDFIATYLGIKKRDNNWHANVDTKAKIFQCMALSKDVDGNPIISKSYKTYMFNSGIAPVFPKDGTVVDKPAWHMNYHKHNISNIINGADGLYGTNAESLSNAKSLADASATDKSNRAVDFRHGSFANCSFLDGHAESRKATVFTVWAPRIIDVKRDGSDGFSLY